MANSNPRPVNGPSTKQGIKSGKGRGNNPPKGQTFISKHITIFAVCLL